MEESTSEILTNNYEEEQINDKNESYDNISTCADIGDNKDTEQINNGKDEDQEIMSEAEDGEVEEGEYKSDEFEGADDE